MAVCKQLSILSKLFGSLKVNGLITNESVRKVTSVSMRPISTTICRRDLMEFFDDKKNWPEREVKVGRSWRLDELRIKSNSDLHKLWYILLKEKNMLLTMEHACKEEWTPFPNPERLDKVEESMENLEKVVRERNRAYWELEVGETGERPTREDVSFTGLTYRYHLRQHRVPERLNTKYRAHRQMMTRMDDKKAQEEFLSLYREQRWNTQRKKNVRDFNHVCGLVRRFPNLDLDAVRKEYPDVDIKKVLASRRSRGHRENNTS